MYCYRKINFEKEYMRMSQEQQISTCKNERDKFVEALGSENMRFSHVLQEKINILEGT
jgi:hypothetical protein